VRTAAGDALCPLRVAIGRGVAGRGGWALDHEPALRADGDDDRVLDRLRLDQSEDLGAVVLQPVRPAQPAAGDRAEAQVDALHPRGVHERLDGRARLGDPGHLLGVELERQELALLAVGVVAEVHAGRGR